MRTPKFQSSIPPIDKGTAGDDMVAAVNDRIRRIELGLNQTTEIKSTTPAVASRSWVEEVPAGLLDGVNVVFSLSSTPIAGSLTLFLNIVQMEGTDFTISGGTITFTVAPKARDTGYFLARYQR